MQTFRNYLLTTSNRGHYLEMGKAAKVLASITDDPRGIILDLVEESMPHLHGPLLEAFYLEADATPAPTPAATPAASGGHDEPALPADAVAKGDNKAGASDSGSVMDWLRGLFGGGGAEKSFGRAMAALKKVDSVLQTIHVPKEAQGEDSDAAGYDDYKKEVNELYKKLQELGRKSKLLNVADGIKKDPNYVQQLQQLQQNPVISDEMAADAKEKAAETPAAPASGGAGGGDPNNHAVTDTVVGEEMQKAMAGKFDGFPPDAQAEVAEEWEKIKGIPDSDPKKHQRFAYLMRYHKHQRQNEMRNRGGKLVRESVFSEALILAGVPARRRK